MLPTLKRIEVEAIRSGFFNEVVTYTEFELSKEFRKRFKNHLNIFTRGYGYWIWKAAIIIDELNKCKENDFLVYADAGFIINAKGEKKFFEYLNRINASEFKIGAVELEKDKLEKFFTKKAVFEYLRVSHDTEITNTPQIQAGLILIQKNNNTVEFFKEIMHLYLDRIDLVGDELSEQECDGFIAHRHDQSIFSVKLKSKGGGFLIPLDQVGLLDNNDYPFITARKKNGKLIGIFYMFLCHLKRFIGVH